MSDSQGNFIWHELATSDIKGAIAFYTDVVGWGTQDFEGSGGSYVIWTAGGTGVGGVMAQKMGAPPHWLAYVMADDVDALTEKAKALGAKICAPPRDIPAVGRFSVITDPQGAAIALMTPSGPDVPRPAETPSGHFSWNELIAGDREGAFRFYSELFGWQKTGSVEAPSGTYQMYGKGDRMFGGMMTRPEGHPAPPHWLYYAKVDDLDAAVARVGKRGGQVLYGPMEVPGGSRVSQCVDPQGAAFALHGE